MIYYTEVATQLTLYSVHIDALNLYSTVLFVCWGLGHVVWWRGFYDGMGCSYSRGIAFKDVIVAVAHTLIHNHNTALGDKSEGKSHEHSIKHLLQMLHNEFDTTNLTPQI